MSRLAVQSQLEHCAQLARRRRMRTPFVCYAAGSLICGATWGAYAHLYAATLGSATMGLISSWGLMAAGCGLGAGLVASYELWQWLRRRFDAGLHAQVRNNMFDHGLLLMALEPVPASALVAVFDVPGREHGPLESLPLPQTPSALHTQSFEHRLQLLIERYARACRAQRLQAYPEQFERLVRLCSLCRVSLPLGGVLLIAAVVMLSMPFPYWLYLALVPLLVTLITARAVLDEMLQGVAFGAVCDVVVADLTPTPPPAAPPVDAIPPRSEVGGKDRQRRLMQ